MGQTLAGTITEGNEVPESFKVVAIEYGGEGVSHSKF